MDRNEILNIAELPYSDRTLKVGDNLLMLSDNLSIDEPEKYLSIPQGSQEKYLSPFRIEFTAVILCVRGKQKVRINLIEYELDSNTLLIVPEGSIGEYQQNNAYSGLVMIVFSQKINPLEGMMVSFPDNIGSIYAIRCMHLLPEETQAILDIYHIMRSRIEDSSFNATVELARAAIMMIVSYISPYLENAVIETPLKKSSHSVFNAFLQLLDRHITSHRNLAFYASQLSMTPRTLSRIIMQHTGRSAKQWISERLILEAKVRLSLSHLSILQVSEELGFPNQSFFGSFFRRNAGQSPLEYRRQNQLSDNGNR